VVGNFATSVGNFVTMIHYSTATVGNFATMVENLVTLVGNFMPTVYNFVVVEISSSSPDYSR
jgi:hypothetical protein